MRSSHCFFQNTKNGSMNRGRDKHDNANKKNESMLAKKKPKTKNKRHSTRHFLPHVLPAHQTPQKPLSSKTPIDDTRLHKIKRRHRRITPIVSPNSHQTFALMCLTLLAVSHFAAAEGFCSDNYKGLKNKLNATCSGKTRELISSNKMKNKTLTADYQRPHDLTWLPVSCLEERYNGIYFGTCEEEIALHKRYSSSITNPDIHQKVNEVHYEIMQNFSDQFSERAESRYNFLNNPDFTESQKMRALRMEHSYTILEFATIVNNTINSPSNPRPFGNCGEYTSLALFEIFALEAEYDVTFNLSKIVLRNSHSDHAYLLISDHQNSYICDPWNNVFKNTKLEDHTWPFYNGLFNKTVMPIERQDQGADLPPPANKYIPEKVLLYGSIFAPRSKTFEFEDAEDDIQPRLYYFT